MTAIELAEKGKFYGKVNHGGLVSNWTKGKTTPTPVQFNKMCKILELPFEDIEEVEREVIGTKKSLALPINDQLKGWGEKREYNITIPSTDLAKQWQGWGTALKPSFEPIIVARKPFKGSLVDNVIENGVGGINIDECRVNPTGEKLGRNNHVNTYGGVALHTSNTPGLDQSNKPDNGRFPANTILTYDETDFDEVCGGFPNTKSGGNINFDNVKNDSIYGSIPNRKGFYQNRIDSGSASRYFYCAKASKKDRDEGLDEFEEKQLACVTDFRPTLATHPENWNNGNPVDNPMMRTTPRKNVHPTVKPTSLMQYLVRLVTPNGGTILDPFNGSGSTGKAVMYENLERNKNYKYIGIELTEEYLPIAKARIEYVCNQEKQTTIDDFVR